MTTISFSKKQLVLISLSLFIFISFCIWIYNRNHISTDNAYINANIVQIAPRVSGQIVHTYVNNNQLVKENQPLFDIDPIPYEIAVNEARAQLEHDEALLSIAQMTAKRTLQLVIKKVASMQEGDVAAANLQSAQAAVQLSKANLDKAILHLRYTHVVSPTSGWVTNFSLRAGNIVTENQQIFALISDNQFWIDANFKETHLNKIHPGQQAKIKIDMYPNYVFKGVVESISGGTGAAFSLLPPQNATGNWVKVTQRVPVRVLVLNPDSKHPLRIGTSADVKIYL